MIAFLDDDTILEPEYFAELLACFERHPDAVGVGGYITNGGVEWRRVGEEEQKAESRKQKTERTAAEETQGRSLPAELPAQPGPPPPQVSGLPSSRKDSTTSFGVQVLPASRIPKPASRITHHASRFPLAVFRWGEWERPEDARWVLRKRLGLGVPDEYPPGWLPPGGHNHSCTFYPPDGKDHRVESLIGCSFAWRASLFQQESFSEYFVGYGLYEDLEFCIRALGHGNLYMCTRARLEHHHAPSGRPRHFHYGVMVVRNGWYVWRQRWALPPMAERWRWWAVTLLLTLCRLGNVFSHGQQGALPEACGRFWGMLRVLVRPPR